MLRHGIADVDIAEQVDNRRRIFTGRDRVNAGQIIIACDVAVVVQVLEQAVEFAFPSLQTII